jgi:hypothetical protein
MGTYLKTKYPGIFKYVGSKGEVYGVDYYAGGKKHREIVGPLLTEAQEKLADLRKSARDGGYMSLAARRKFTFDQLAKEYEEKQRGETYFDKTRKYYVPIIKAFFAIKGCTRLAPLTLRATRSRGRRPRPGQKGPVLTWP